MNNEIEPVKTYWASVSGGKDSLLMLQMILNRPEQYPLNGVVHFELEIDYPFIMAIIDDLERECQKRGLKMYRIKPRKSWEELYKNNGYPTRLARWCNSKYKMDAQRQFVKWQKDLNTIPYFYIGYCYDEEQRYSKGKSNEIYPLVDLKITENSILKWAQKQEKFKNYYKTNRRCGCMMCPLSSYISFAYCFKYYPNFYYKQLARMKETEQRLSKRYGCKFSVTSGEGKYDSEYLDYIVKTKWVKILEEKEAAF